jgi:uncharacterized membrane protein
LSSSSLLCLLVLSSSSSLYVAPVHRLASLFGVSWSVHRLSKCPGVVTRVASPDVCCHQQQIITNSSVQSWLPIASDSCTPVGLVLPSVMACQCTEICEIKTVVRIKFMVIWFVSQHVAVQFGCGILTSHVSSRAYWCFVLCLYSSCSCIVTLHCLNALGRCLQQRGLIWMSAGRFCPAVVLCSCNVSYRFCRYPLPFTVVQFIGRPCTLLLRHFSFL